MAELKIQIRDKVATLISQDFQLVGGNSDYKVVFDFDEAWDKHQVKTALFVFGDKTIERVVDGNVCDGVAITNSTICLIGVYASDICTTTPAKVCDIKLSIKDFATALPQPPEKDVYDQLIELMNRYIENAQNANLPRGGLAGQVLSKKSNEDFDFEWKDVEASEEARKEIQNITSIDVIYDDVSDLPKTGVGNGTRYVALNNGRLPLIIYSYSSTKNEWEIVDECRGSTAYIVLQGEKAGMYRFTMSPPYLVSVESHTLQEANDYTEDRLGDLGTQADGTPNTVKSYVDIDGKPIINLHAAYNPAVDISSLPRFDIVDGEIVFVNNNGETIEEPYNKKGEDILAQQRLVTGAVIIEKNSNGWRVKRKLMAGDLLALQYVGDSAEHFNLYRYKTGSPFFQLIHDSRSEFYVFSDLSKVFSIRDNITTAIPNPTGGYRVPHEIKTALGQVSGSVKIKEYNANIGKWLAITDVQAGAICLNLADGALYVLDYDYNRTENQYFKPASMKYITEAEERAKAYADEKIGDISTALDELHAYAQSLIGGDSE